MPFFIPGMGYRYKWRCPICKARFSSNTRDGLERVKGLHLERKGH